MLISCVATPNFFYFSDKLKWSVDKLGYDFNLHKIAADPKFKTATRPLIWQKVRENIKGRIFCLDADCMMLNRVDELEIDDYDVALHPKLKVDGERIVFKAGVFVLQDTDAARRFLQLWIDAIYSRSDQKGLNKLMGNNFSLVKETKDTGMLEIEGIRIKLLGKEYLHEVYFEESIYDVPKNQKIIHFSGNDPTLKKGRPAKIPVKKDYIEKFIDHHFSS